MSNRPTPGLGPGPCIGVLGLGHGPSFVGLQVEGRPSILWLGWAGALGGLLLASAMLSLFKRKVRKATAEIQALELELGERRRKEEVILSSGFNERESIQGVLERGLAGFIKKPYTLKSLGEKIADVLKNRP